MLLELDHLSIGLKKQDGAEYCIVHEVSLALQRGETFGLLGASGTGKTLLAYALCGLLSPPMQLLGGSIRFRGEQLFPGGRHKLISKRGKQILMIFQSAAAALNPYLTVGRQIAEALEQAERLSRKAALSRAAELLERVGLSPSTVSSYPHQLSGGMQQRVLIAIALGLRPEILIADEPTTGLDAISALRILELLRSLKEEGMAMLFISHDLKAISYLADQTGVLCGGRLVESGPARQLLTAPQHEYARELIAACNML